MANSVCVSVCVCEFVLNVARWQPLLQQHGVVAAAVTSCYVKKLPAYQLSLVARGLATCFGFLLFCHVLYQAGLCWF